MISLAHEICVQILKVEVVMDKIMDHVVETQLKVYNTICDRIWENRPMCHN